MAGHDHASAGSDRLLDRDGPGAALAPRKDAIGRIAADRVAADSAAVATLAGGMVLGAFYPAEAKAALVGATSTSTTPAGVDEADRTAGAHGGSTDQELTAPEAVPSLHDAAALIQAEGEAVLAHLEAAFGGPGAATGSLATASEQVALIAQASSALGSSAQPDIALVSPIAAGDATGGSNALPRGLSDAVTGDHGGASDLLDTRAALVPNVAGIGDGVTHTLDAATSALPSGLDHLLGTTEGPVAMLSEALTTPIHAVTDASGHILAPAAKLTHVADEIGAPVLGRVADLASGPVDAAAWIAAVAPNLVAGTVGPAADHAAVEVSGAVEGVVQPVSAPLDLPSLNLGFLGQSYSDLGYGEVGPHHDQGLLHGLV